MCVDKKRLLLCLFVGACAKNPAPSGWLAPAERAQRDPYGGWIEISYRVAERDAVARGEFIAVSDDSVFVLPPRADLAAIPRAQIRRAKVAFYDAQWAGLATWTIIGSLSTASHGWFLGISLPIWTIAGPVATGAASRGPIESVRSQRDWEAVSKFARFPQGLPEEIDRAVLRPKGD